MLFFFSKSGAYCAVYRERNGFRLLLLCGWVCACACVFHCQGRGATLNFVSSTLKKKRGSKPLAPGRVRDSFGNEIIAFQCVSGWMEVTKLLINIRNALFSTLGKCIEGFDEKLVVWGLVRICYC